jgi:hypothetical protein
MKILTTRSQLRYTLETAHRVIFEPGAGIGTMAATKTIETSLEPSTEIERGDSAEPLMPNTFGSDARATGDW